MACARVPSYTLYNMVCMFFELVNKFACRSSSLPSLPLPFYLPGKERRKKHQQQNSRYYRLFLSSVPPACRTLTEVGT